MHVNQDSYIFISDSKGNISVLLSKRSLIDERHQTHINVIITSNQNDWLVGTSITQPWRVYLTPETIPFLAKTPRTYRFSGLTVHDFSPILSYCSTIAVTGKSGFMFKNTDLTFTKFFVSRKAIKIVQVCRMYLRESIISQVNDFINTSLVLQNVRCLENGLDNISRFLGQVSLALISAKYD